MKRTFDPTRGIKCPACRATTSGIKETRQGDGDILRVRVCVCGQRYVTIEKFERITKSFQPTTIGSGSEPEAS